MQILIICVSSIFASSPKALGLRQILDTLLVCRFIASFRYVLNFISSETMNFLTRSIQILFPLPRGGASQRAIVYVRWLYIRLVI